VSGCFAFEARVTTIRVDVRGAIEAARDFEQLREQIRRRIVIAALHRAGVAMKTEARRIITDELALDKRSIEEVLAVWKPSISRPSVKLNVHHLAIPLYRFKAKQVKKGVSVSVTKAGGRKVAKGKFVARMKSGHAGVFERTGPHDPKKLHRVKRGRNAGKRYFAALPIDEKFGPEPYQVIVNQDGAMDRIRERGIAVFEERFAHELDRVLERG
jgi:hypothetical protein